MKIHSLAQINTTFVVIQFVGVIAWLFLFFSYYRKDRINILTFQIISTILYSIHYYFLGATSGLLICIFETLIGYLYYKTNLDLYIFIAAIPIYIVLGFISYNTIVDLLPIIAGVIESYSLTNNKKVIVTGAIISYSLWVIYDIYAFSFSGVITDGLVALSNISILLFSYNFLQKEKTQSPNNPKVLHK